MFWFGFVLLVALANPSGFIVVLEVFTSLALNLEAGLFVGLMYIEAIKVASSSEDERLLTADT